MPHLSLVLALIVSWSWPTLMMAMDFTPKDDSQSLEMEATPEDDASVSGDSELSTGIEAEQPEIRVTRARALGIRLGEALPHTSLGVTYQHVINDIATVSGIISRGEFRTAEQSEGEAWVENKAKTWLVAARYLWWPNPNFPFAMSAALSVESAWGSLSSRTGAHGDYRTETAYVSTGLVMSHIFQSGLWLEWTLISINYGQVLKGHYRNATAHQMETVRKNLNGFKVLGFANLAVGYAW